jgi:mono/diheme cytochrome c family protein
MPAFRGKLTDTQMGQLIVFVRAFGSKSPPAAPKEGSVDEGFRRLQGELDDLQKQFRDNSKVPATVRSEPSQDGNSVPNPHPEATPDTAKLFRQHCRRCHGDDGTGTPAQDRLPEIPNFTVPEWQARRSEYRLAESILGGIGEMPAFREKLNKMQAQALAAHVRKFVVIRPMPPEPQVSEYRPPTADRRSPPPPPTEEEKTPTPQCFSKKLIDWLGRFHQAAVHFPIALLTAAGLAEVLRMAQGPPTLATVARFCIWLGFLSAGVAAPLGWFQAGFHLADESPILMAHRWLGTATLASAGLVLLLSEASRRADSSLMRGWYRLVLFGVCGLVLATGLFGGFVVYGPEHYRWPQ